MATGGRITAMATDGPTMVTDMDMGVAGATKRGPAKNVDFLVRGLNQCQWARQCPPGISVHAERDPACPTGVPGFLRNPSHFARLGLRRLPNLDEQHIVSSIGAAFENNLRPIVRLGIDSKELGGRMRNDDEIAADFDLNFRVVGHCPDRLAIYVLAATSLNKGRLV